MQSMYLKTLIIYLAIIGVILKFTLDDSANLEFKQALFGMGIITSIAMLTTCICGEKIRRSIVDEIQSLNEMLGSPLISCELIHLKYSSMSIFIFVVFVIIGFVYFIFQ
ncbi:MAG: hypothetical protein C5S40_07470 [ANME-2 cluster archaeon]|nr:hypothetical protein [ANME-2 cluster archaeon]